jgi:UDP-N-acetyl-D-galactosamine dehydrogenase
MPRGTAACTVSPRHGPEGAGESHLGAEAPRRLRRSGRRDAAATAAAAARAMRTATHGRRIGIVGLGYVGLPVAMAFARTGVSVVGFDIDAARVDELQRGHDRTLSFDADALSAARIAFSADPAALATQDFHIVTVPTPIDAARRPDLSALLSACRMLGPALRPGAIVVFESTVYPGTTEFACMPVLEETSGLRAVRDFSVGYSPERINPGDHIHTFESVTKIVSALDAPTCDELAAVYGSVVQAGIHRAASIKVAEAAKVIENAQRDLNIAFVNELSAIFHRLGLDTADVLEAASTKWNFLPFKPGLVGGHCIGVDPYYLTHCAEMVGYHPEVILAGRRINDGVSRRIARECARRLMQRRLNDPRVTVLGVTFKEDIPDTRNSKAIDLALELASFGLTVQACDPLADGAAVADHYGLALTPVDRIEPAHAVILAVTHAPYLAGGWPLIQSLLTGGEGLVMDVKAVLPRAQKPPGIDLWRL